MSDFWIGVVVTVLIWWVSGAASMLVNKKIGHTGPEERAFAATLLVFCGPIIAIAFLVDFLRHRAIGNNVKQIEK